MEVFIASGPYNEGSIRAMMLELTLKCWSEVAGVRITAAIMHHSQRFQWAAEQALNQIYCVADDDCIPCPWLSLKRVEELFEQSPEVGIMALKNPLHKHTEGAGELTESEGVGGIRFLRKGIVMAWPEHFNGDDSAFAKIIKPFKGAYLNHYPMIHMGEFHSMWQLNNAQGK